MSELRRRGVLCLAAAPPSWARSDDTQPARAFDASRRRTLEHQGQASGPAQAQA